MKMAGEENAERRTSNSESFREQAVQRPTEGMPAEGSPSSRKRGTTVRQAPNSESFPEQAAQQPALSESGMGRIEDTSAKELSLQRAPPANPAATAEPASGVAEPEAPAEGPPNVREPENVQLRKDSRAGSSTPNTQRSIQHIRVGRWVLSVGRWAFGLR